MASLCMKKTQIKCLYSNRSDYITKKITIHLETISRLIIFLITQLTLIKNRLADRSSDSIKIFSVNLGTIFRFARTPILLTIIVLQNIRWLSFYGTYDDYRFTEHTMIIVLRNIRWLSFYGKYDDYRFTEHTMIIVLRNIRWLSFYGTYDDWHTVRK